MPKLIEEPTVIKAVGNKPKTIEEYAGRVNSGHSNTSVARMVSPEGWVEPGQRPDFEEITLVLRGLLQQEPHTEDEVYYVLSGEGTLQVEGKDQPVKAGSILFVAKNVDHRFHSITSELSLLVFFAPEEGG